MTRIDSGWLLHNLKDVTSDDRIVCGILGNKKWYHLDITYYYEDHSLAIALISENVDFRDPPIYMTLDHNVKSAEDLLQLANLLGLVK